MVRSPPVPQVSRGGVPIPQWTGDVRLSSRRRERLRAGPDRCGRPEGGGPGPPLLGGVAVPGRRSPVAGAGQVGSGRRRRDPTREARDVAGGR